MGPFESALRSARALDAKTIRCGLTTVLCGDRHALGENWQELVAERPRRARRHTARAPPTKAGCWRSRTIRISAATSLSASARRRAASASASTPATRFPSPRRRSISSRASRPHVRHVHLKDYRVQFTDEGYRLVRCAIGDGAVPIAAMLDILARASSEADRGAGAGRAGGAARALAEAGMVATAMPPKSAPALAACLAAARVNRLRRRRRLPHAVGARRRWRARRLRTRHDPPQRRQHARARPCALKNGD